VEPDHDGLSTTQFRRRYHFGTDAAWPDDPRPQALC
jgi:hypothetical protein